MVHEIQKTFLLPDATLLEKLQKDGIVFEIYEIEKIEIVYKKESI